MTTIVLDYGTAAGNRSRPLIGIDNILSRPDVTTSASSEASGGGFHNNAFDGVPYDQWVTTSGTDQWLRVSRSEPLSCNYAAIHRHNLGTKGGSYRVQYSTEVSPVDSDPNDWTDALSWQTVSSDGTVMSTFNEISARHWRIGVQGSGSLSIGIIHLGKTLELPKGPTPGFAPPEFAEVALLSTPYTHDGNPAPRSIIRRAAQIDLELDLVDDHWVRNYWLGFRRQVETENFFFMWSPYYYPDKVAYCWLDGRRGPAPVRYDRVMHATLALSFMAATE